VNSLWYGLALLFTFYFVFFQKRLISFGSLFFAGIVLYGSPLLLGRIQFVESYRYALDYNEPIAPLVYVLFISLLCVCIVMLFIENHMEYIKPHLLDKTELYVLSFFQLLFLFIHFAHVGVAPIVTADKDFLVKHASVFYFFSSFLASLLIILYCLHPDKKRAPFLVFPVVSLIIDLYTGYRTNFFLTFCAVILAGTFQLTRLRVTQRLAVVFAGFSVVFLAFIYKAIYYSVQVGGISNLQFVTPTTFVGSEPFVIMGNLNEIFLQSYVMSSEEKVQALVQFVPLSKSFLGFDDFSMNKFLQTQVFMKTEWGIASSGLGSLYAYCGLIGVITYGLFLLMFVSFFYNLHSCLSKAIALFWAPYILFYFHRNDWFYAIGVLKLLLVALLPLLMFKAFLKVLEFIKKINADKSLVSS
jgi:hypothetical protein